MLGACRSNTLCKRTDSELAQKLDKLELCVGHLALMRRRLEHPQPFHKMRALDCQMAAASFKWLRPLVLARRSRVGCRTHRPHLASGARHVWAA